MKTRVAVLFGGRSVEHEVSIISGVQALLSINTDDYDVTPVYISKDNELYVGEGLDDIASYRDIPALLSKATRVVFVNEGGRVYLSQYPAKLMHNLKLEIDVAFPVVHGTNVEDGALQGYLKTLGVPFVGCDVCAAAVGMDKFIQKQVLKEAGIPVLDATTFTTADYADMDSLVARVEERFGYPVIVKPLNLGSSVGIGVAHDAAELASRVDDAFLYASRVLVEHAVTNLREINCSVLGDDDAAEASVLEEPMHTDQILSYKDKYLGGGGKSGAKGAAGAKTAGAKGSSGAGMASLSRQIPAPLSDELTAKIREMSVRAFQALGCNGVARIDYILDGDTGEVYFNEINTIPGSLSFYLWEPTGVKYPELLHRMIQLALKRARQQAALTFTFDTNILANAQIGQGAKGGVKS